MSERGHLPNFEQLEAETQLLLGQLGVRVSSIVGVQETTEIAMKSRCELRNVPWTHGWNGVPFRMPRGHLNYVISDDPTTPPLPTPYDLSDTSLEAVTKTNTTSYMVRLRAGTYAALVSVDQRMHFIPFPPKVRVHVPQVFIRENADVEQVAQSVYQAYCNPAVPLGAEAVGSEPFSH